MALVEGARARRDERPFLDAFLQEFGLSNQEGIALMCIAEALLRIPDDATADRLIAEKLATGDWSAHSGKSESLFVSNSSFGCGVDGCDAGGYCEVMGAEQSIGRGPGMSLRNRDSRECHSGSRVANQTECDREECEATKGIVRVPKSIESKRKKPSPQLLALVGRLLIFQESLDGTLRQIYDPVGRARRLVPKVRAKRAGRRN
jgi:hypothetical protein